MKKTKIALISDLHVGVTARGLDLCPFPVSEDKKVGRASDFLSRFEAWASEHASKPLDKVDYLCITGDISNTGHSEEFALADTAIKRIREALSLPEERLFYVPGNHDVHWPVMKLEPSHFWLKHRYAPLLQETLGFKRRMRSAEFGRFDDTPFAVVWRHGDLVVLGVNTSAYDGPQVEPHHGLIKQETIDQLDAFLKTLALPPECLRVCLLHHHLDQYSERLPDVADHSIAVNAENLVRMLSSHRVDIVLHGHKHYPRLGARQPDNQHPFVMLCAGSFSAVLDPIWHEGTPNLFHVVNINGRDAKTGRIFGQVDTWSYQAHKWQAGNGVAGLYANESFGSGSTPSEVKEQIRESLQNRLKDSSACEWSKIVLDNPTLRHIRTDVAYECFTEVAEAMGFEVVGDRNTPSKKWVAFRRTE